MHHAGVFEDYWHEAHGLRAYIVASLVLHLLLLLAVASYRPEKSLPVAYKVRLLPPAPVEEVVTVPPASEYLPPGVLEGPAVPEAAERPEDSGPVELPQAPSMDEPEDAGEGPGAVATPGIDALFDTAVLDRRAVEPVKRPGEKTGVTFDTTEMMLSGYMGLLKQKIEAIWHYPRAAAEAGIYGNARISFVIRRDGTLGSVKLVQTSGHPELDQAAIDALKEAEPYWPLPDGYDGEALYVNGTFIYTLSGWYVR